MLQLVLTHPGARTLVHPAVIIAALVAMVVAVPAAAAAPGHDVVVRGNDAGNVSPLRSAAAAAGEELREGVRDEAGADAETAGDVTRESAHEEAAEPPREQASGDDAPARDEEPARSDVPAPDSDEPAPAPSDIAPPLADERRSATLAGDADDSGASAGEGDPAAAQQARRRLVDLTRTAGMRVRVVLMAPDGTVIVNERGNERTLAASVAKLSVAGCLLGEARRGRDLPARERQLLARMLQWSDNAAADALRRQVPAGCPRRLARAAGFTVAQPGGRWGVAHLSAHDAARLARALPGFVDERHRARLLDLLGSVADEQAWGRGRMPDGVTLRAKPGMLPPGMTGGSGSLAAQAGLLDVSDGACPGYWAWGVVIDRAGSVPQASRRVAELVEQAARIAVNHPCP